MASEALLHSCHDIFPEAILLLDQHGILLAFNESARHQLRAVPIEPGHTFLVDICSNPAEQLQAYLRCCLRTKNFLPGIVTFNADPTALAFRAEGALYNGDDDISTRKILLRLTPRQAAASRFLALNQQVEKLSREVDRRRRLEVELIEQREQLRVTLAGIGDAVIATDIEGRITLLNPAAETLTGWTNTEALGKPLPEVFYIINEETRTIVESPVERVIRDGIVVGLANHTILIRKDGSELHIDDSGAPIRNVHGTIIGAVLVFHDISDRRLLEKTIEAHTRELEDEHRRKDEFLAMLGHELRNPLAPIKTALQLQSLPNSNPETHQRARDIMIRQVDHLIRLVNELLDVARITTGKIDLQNDRLDIATVIHRAAELCEPLIREKNQEFFVELPGEPVYIDGDLQRLIQAIGNVLNNAAKYTQHKGTIRLILTPRETDVEILIADNGMGMHASILPRIFDAFSQSKRSLARSEGGLGVGLTLAQRLIDQHGGKLTAHSEGLQKGSEFRIVLPLAPSVVQSHSEGSGPQAVAIKQRKILVVDDNQDAVTMLSMLLTLRGNDVITAFNGEEAITAARRMRPSVIFLDIGLPGMDGYTVAKTLRGQPETAAATLIAVTGYGQDEDKRKSKAAGFSYHLVKPADLNEIDKILMSIADN